MSLVLAGNDLSLAIHTCNGFVWAVMVLHDIRSCSIGTVRTSLFCMFLSIVALPLTDPQEVATGTAVEVTFAIDFVQSEGLRRYGVAAVWDSPVGAGHCIHLNVGR